MSFSHLQINCQFYDNLNLRGARAYAPESLLNLVSSLKF